MFSASQYLNFPSIAVILVSRRWPRRLKCSPEIIFFCSSRRLLYSWKNACIYYHLFNFGTIPTTEKIQFPVARFYHTGLQWQFYCIWSSFLRFLVISWSWSGWMVIMKAIRLLAHQAWHKCDLESFLWSIWSNQILEIIFRLVTNSLFQAKYFQTQ